jgi:hypothetical protein
MYHRHKSVDRILGITLPWYFNFFGEHGIINLHEETNHTSAIMWHFLIIVPIAEMQA